jgi:hypothetical protein
VNLIGAPQDYERAKNKHFMEVMSYLVSELFNGAFSIETVASDGKITDE